ncbi:MAG: hypothetical protein ABH803_02565 [Candidatus Micrarchaeota archaeon]
MTDYTRYYPEGFLRSFAPGFSRLSQPKHFNYPVKVDELRKNHEVIKTKAELVSEYHQVMLKVNANFIKSGLAGMATLFFLAGLLDGATGQLNSLAFIGSLCLAVFWYWQAGATYSNWQEFEMRPVLMPVEDISAEGT